MIKEVTYAHLGPIWYHSEPSDVPYFPYQFFGWDFFCRFLQQDSSSLSQFSLLGSFFFEGTRENILYIFRALIHGHLPCLILSQQGGQILTSTLKIAPTLVFSDLPTALSDNLNK